MRLVLALLTSLCLLVNLNAQSPQWSAMQQRPSVMNTVIDYSVTGNGVVWILGRNLGGDLVVAYRTSLTSNWVLTNTPPDFVYFWIEVNPYQANSPIFIGGSNELYRSTNNGASWTLVNNGLSINQALNFLPNGEIVSSSASETRISSNNGNTWQTFFNNDFREVRRRNDGRYFLLNDVGVYTKTTGTWSQVYTQQGTQVYQMMDIDQNGNVYLTRQGFDADLVVSTNSGTSWTTRTTVPFATDIAVTDSGWVFVATFNNGVYLSTDFGFTFAQTLTGSTTDEIDFDEVHIDANGYVYASKDQYFRTQISVFQPLYFERHTQATVQGQNIGHMLELQDGRLLAFNANNTLYTVSTDGGNSWTASPSFPQGGSVRKVLQHNSGIILVGAGEFRVGRSTDNGVTWNTPIYMNGVFINNMALNDSGYVISANTNGIYTSADTGRTFTLGQSFNGAGQLRGTFASQQLMLVGATTGELFRSTNNGRSWSVTNTAHAWNVFYQDSTQRIWAGTSQTLLFSDDEGLSWDTLPNYNFGAVTHISKSPVTEFAIGTSSNQIYGYTPQGWKWLSFGWPALTTAGMMYAPLHNRIYTSGLYRTKDGNLPGFIGVSESDNQAFKIHMYPNPASDFIQLQMPANWDASFVQIQVYDVQGRQVLNQRYTGLISVTNWPAGVYIMHIQYDKNQVVTKFIKS